MKAAVRTGCSSSARRRQPSFVGRAGTRSAIRYVMPVTVPLQSTLGSRNPPAEKHLEFRPGGTHRGVSRNLHHERMVAAEQALYPSSGTGGMQASAL